ncbi:MAG TPA: transposase, partial [Pseudonocardiaceae bacterium]|nr:transposase [Pseudonocardiaceae bacterium]
MPAPKKYPDELRERAVRLYRESDPKPVIRRLAEQLNVHHEALRNWIRQDEADRGERHDLPSTDTKMNGTRCSRGVALVVASAGDRVEPDGHAQRVGLFDDLAHGAPGV